MICGSRCLPHVPPRVLPKFVFWCGHLLKLQDFRTAEFLYPNSFHCSSSRWEAVSAGTR
jgi:hypothetical protein